MGGNAHYFCNLLVRHFLDDCQTEYLTIAIWQSIDSCHQFRHRGQRSLFRSCVLLCNICICKCIEREHLRLMVSLLVAQGHIGGDACQPLFKASRVAQLIHFGKGQQKCIVSQFFSHLVVTHDALAYHLHSLVICPVQASECHLVALDAKVNFDDAALKRHPAIAALDDPEEADPLELKAKEAGVNYVHLGGEVGTMVNGAGLAMATMDAIKQAGSTPANFLDAGGGANEDMVAAGFSLMLEDPNVKGVLINIFGGILRCDIVAQGVVNAAKRTGMTLPLVIRMEGTNVEEGRRILKESGLNYHPAASMSEAARKIAEITGRA